MNGRYSVCIAAGIAEDSSESDAIDVRDFKFFAVELPTAAVGLASSTVSVYLKGCHTSDGTFRSITTDEISLVASAVTGDVIASVNHYVPEYIKVCMSNNTATAAGYAAKVHCFY
jgi:hypothetical protein